MIFNVGFQRFPTRFQNFVVFFNLADTSSAILPSERAVLGIYASECELQRHFIRLSMFADLHTTPIRPSNHHGISPLCVVVSPISLAP